VPVLPPRSLSRGGGITFEPELYSRGKLIIEQRTVKEFYVKAGMSLDAGATTGQINFNASVGAGAACTLELGGIESPALPVSVFSLQFQVSPSIGVDLAANLQGPSLSLNGPQGSVLGQAEAGMCYKNTQGWYACNSRTFDANYQPPGADLSTGVSFTANAGPYGQLDLGLLASIGRPPLAVPLADVKFAEVKAGADLGFEFNSPFDPQQPDYHGPSWDIEAYVIGSYKAELSAQGVLGLVERLGIPTSISFGLSGELFNKTIPLLDSPDVVVTPDCDSAQGGSIDVEVGTGSGDDDGTAQLLDIVSVPYGGDPLVTTLGSGAIVNGNASVSVARPDLGQGYRIYPRVEIDGLSDIFPYTAGGASWWVGIVDNSSYGGGIDVVCTPIGGDAGGGYGGGI